MLDPSSRLYQEPVGSVDEGRAPRVFIFPLSRLWVPSPHLTARLRIWGLEKLAGRCAAGPVLVRGVRCYHSWFECRDEDIKKRAEGAKLGGITAAAEPCSSEGPWHGGETSRGSTKGHAMSCRGEGITPEEEHPVGCKPGI